MGGKVMLTVREGSVAVADAVATLAEASTGDRELDLVVVRQASLVSPGIAYGSPGRADAGRRPVPLPAGTRVLDAGSGPDAVHRLIRRERPDRVYRLEEGRLARRNPVRRPGTIPVRGGAALVPIAADRAAPRAADAAWYRLGRTLVEVVTGFYRERLGWLALFTSMIVLAYGGGAVMFYVHSIYLGEGGPAISPWYHWLLDSSAGFLGLGPPLAVALPLIVWLGARRVGEPGPVRPAGYALAGGAAFALITVPGPIAHDVLVGRGTWIADHITRWIGTGDPPPPAADLSHSTSMAYQFFVGLPLYIVLMAVSFFLIRAISARSRTALPSTGPG